MKEIIYNNFIYIVGQSAKDNWNIFDIYKKENENYTWFHLNSFPSCYVILCSENINDDELLYGAELCKLNTKYRNLNNIKVMYTKLSNLKKTEKEGEVVVLSKKKIKYYIL